MMDMYICMCVVCAYIYGICCVPVSAMLYICICSIYGMCLIYNVYVICACCVYMACLYNVYGVHAHGMYYICDMFAMCLCMDCVCHTHVYACDVCSVCGPWVWMCVCTFDPHASLNQQGFIKTKHTSLCVWSMFWQCDLHLRVKFSLYLVCLGNKRPMDPSFQNA